MREGESKLNVCNYLARKKLQIAPYPHSTGTENSSLLINFCHKKQ